MTSNEPCIKQGFFISVRLWEERKRLKLSQKNIADYCSVSSDTVRSWEKERTIPGSKLAFLIGCGFDVQYILSGVYSVNMDQVGLGHGDGVPLQNAGNLDSKIEQKILENFRALNSVEKEHVELFVYALQAKKERTSCQ